ncbi:hypothetical protein ABPG77_009146 [Micractinium sp. CCAP 211/92]
MEGYAAWVRRNAGLLSLFETGLSSITWLLPERFSEGEISIEALHTALGLLSSFHDSIVSAPPGAPAPPGVDLALALFTLEQVQVLVELFATRQEERGRGSRYTSLALLESIKALVRLLAWRRSGSRLVLHGGCGNLEQSAEAGRGAPPGVGQGRPQEVFGAFAAFRQNRCHPQEVGGTDAAFPARGSGGTASDKQTAKAGSKAPQAGLSPPTALPERLIYAAELLHILRPLVYSLALRRWGRASWRPWLISLGIDLLSMQLGATGARLAQGSPWFGKAQPSDLGPSLALLRCLQRSRWAAEEERELAARRLRLLAYLLRDPLFSRYTQVALQRWVGASSRVPLLGWLSGRAAEILLGVQRYYSYVERMAGS